MSQRRWNKPEDYTFTETLTLGQWVWEFLRRSGEVVMRTLESQRGRWRLMLSLLDAQAAGVEGITVQNWLEPRLADDERYGEFSAEAAELVNGGYRKLLRLPGAAG